NVIIGGVVFGALAGITYWFPKAFGFTLDERWGQAAFWCWLIGFWLAFTPLYALGLMGMTTRLQHISEPSWPPLLPVADAWGAAVAHVRGQPVQERAVLCQHPNAGAPPRPDRRPVERSNPGVVNLFAAAGLQFRGAAQSRDYRRVLAHEAHRPGPS